MELLDDLDREVAKELQALQKEQELEQKTLEFMDDKLRELLWITGVENLLDAFHPDVNDVLAIAFDRNKLADGRVDTILVCRQMLLAAWRASRGIAAVHDRQMNPENNDEGPVYL